MKPLLAIFLALFLLTLSAKKPCELWWQETLDKGVSMETFQGWLGDADSPSRVAMRTYVKEKGYLTFLDAACGPCIDYVGFKKDNLDIDYTGVDVTEKLVDLAKNRNIKAYHGSIEELPFEDSSFDVAYGRHILEHLEGFEKGLGELIRCGKKEALVTFFLIPTNIAKDKIKGGIENNHLLFHNIYSKRKIEHFLNQHAKVQSFAWTPIGDREIFLHVYLH